MKSLFIIQLFFLFAFATYNPDWVVTNPFNNLYKPTNVTAASQAWIFHLNNVTVCGNAQSDFNVYQFSYKLMIKDTVFYYGTKDLAHQTVPAGSQYCFTYDFLIPSIPSPGFSVNLTLQSPADDICSIGVYFPI